MTFRKNALAVVFSLLPSLALAAADQAALPRSSPEEQGISSAAILRFVNEAEQKLDVVHSVMIVRHGRVVTEGWWAPYAADEPHVLYSLSKSFTSTAIGLAISEGKLSLDDKILSIFPDKAPAFPSKNLQQMRVRDLLRMSSGQRADDIKDFPFMGKEDLVKVFLEIPVPDIPGTHFVYNTPGSYILSAIVQKVTGQTTLDYLKPRLFAPLGIADPTWDTSAQGVSLGGFGLNLHTEDIAKFGQLLLQRGSWNGKQVIPAAWVDEATSLQTANGSDPSSDWNQGYGYQFWRARHGVYRGDGAFGQFCLVIPKSDTVIAITSGTGDMGSVMNLVWDVILPALGDGPLPADPEGDRRLSEKLAGLSLPTMKGQATSPTAAKVSGKRYVFADNPLHIESVLLRSADAGSEPVVELKIGGALGTVHCGTGVWARGTISVDGSGIAPAAASGAWSSEDTFSFRAWRYLTPFATTYDLRFAGDTVILEATDNVGFTGQGPVRLVGSVQP